MRKTLWLAAAVPLAAMLGLGVISLYHDTGAPPAAVVAIYHDTATPDVYHDTATPDVYHDTATPDVNHDTGTPDSYDVH
jgi:hypothetical protein